VAPHPVTNREFTATLGTVLSRPAVLPAPATALRVAFGEMADEVLLTSHRALPARLTDHGHEFAFTTLADTLHHELGQIRERRRNLAIPSAAHGASLVRPATYENSGEAA